MHLNIFKHMRLIVSCKVSTHLPHFNLNRIRLILCPVMSRTAILTDHLISTCTYIARSVIDHVTFCIFTSIIVILFSSAPATRHRLFIDHTVPARPYFYGVVCRAFAKASTPVALSEHERKLKTSVQFKALSAALSFFL